MRNCKRGTVQDLLFLAIVIAVFSIGTIMVFRVSNDLNTKFQSSSQLDSYGKAAFAQINSQYPGIIDNVFILLVVGLSLVSIVLAAMVRYHPIFIAFFIIIFFIIIVLAGIFSNIYQKIALDPSMADVASQLTFTSHLMGVLPWFVAVFGGVLAVVMYKTWRMDADY